MCELLLQVHKELLDGVTPVAVKYLSQALDSGAKRRAEESLKWELQLLLACRCNNIVLLMGGWLVCHKYI